MIYDNSVVYLQAPMSENEGDAVVEMEKIEEEKKEEEPAESETKTE